jgi:hypothetical protein
VRARAVRPVRPALAAAAVAALVLPLLTAVGGGGAAAAGAARKNRFYRESAGLFNKRDVVGVFATLRYIKNDAKAYEVTFATEAGGHSLAMLVVISNDSGDLRRAVDRVVPVFKDTVEQLDAAPGDLA